MTLSKELKDELDTATGQKRAKLLKRLEVVEAFRNIGQQAGMDDPGC